MTPKEFANYVREQVAKENVELVLEDKGYIFADRVRVSGYYDEVKLVCAVGKPVKEWLPILVHEYSHFQQVKKKCWAYQRSFINGEDLSDRFYFWIKGAKYPYEEMKKWMLRLRNFEVDCERRAVKNIKKHNLPLDVDLYCQQANAYVYFYTYALLERKWWKRGHAPYANKNVYPHFPTTLDGRYSRLPKKYIKLYDEFC